MRNLEANWKSGERPPASFHRRDAPSTRSSRGNPPPSFCTRRRAQPLPPMRRWLLHVKAREERRG